MIELADIAAYAAALAIAAAIPGPGMTALVARTIGSGAAGGFAMLAGLVLGDLIYLSFAVFGLAFIASTFATVFVIIKWLSICYLTYLAYSFWTAEISAIDILKAKRRDLMSSTISGLAITLGNPKTIAFYMALLPLVIDLQAVTVEVWVTMLVPVTIAVLCAVGGLFITGTSAARQLLKSERIQRRVHRGAALAMAGAAGTMALREI